MFRVKHADSLLVLFRVRRAILLVFIQRLLYPLGKAIPQTIARFDPELHRRRAVGDDQPIQSLGLVNSVASAQHAAPRMPKDIVVGNLEVLEEVIELVEEQLHGPELGIESLFGKMGGEAGAQLIVQDDGNAVFGRQVVDGEQVVMAYSRAAVKAD